jgi:hypothetical protein
MADIENPGVVEINQGKEAKELPSTARTSVHDGSLMNVDPVGQRPVVTEVVEITTVAQIVAGWLAIIASTGAFILVVLFSIGPTSKQMLGGISFTSEKIFSWHPILMVAAFDFCAIYAVVRISCTYLGVISFVVL